MYMCQPIKKQRKIGGCTSVSYEKEFGKYLLNLINAVRGVNNSVPMMQTTHSEFYMSSATQDIHQLYSFFFKQY